MRQFSLSEMRESLAAAGVRSGETVIMHSSLLTLGALRDCDMKSAPRALVESFLDYLGPRGVLAAPAFNFGFCRGTPFERERTSASSMGVLAETIRTWPGAQRSRHPAQSIAAIGPAATQLCDDVGLLAFGEGSAFARLVDCDARVLLLGINLQAASLIHGAEESMGVPYRYWKEFRGMYVEGGVEREHTCRMYVRDLTIDPQLIMKPLEVEMTQAGTLRTVPLGRGFVMSCTARHLLAAALALLGRDPFALVPALQGACGQQVAVRQ
jgi:aminoglycoside 3-N-acetyltransferase